MPYNPALYMPQSYQPVYQPPVMPQTQNQTKYVEVIPVDAVTDAENCPMASGTSGLFFARDDSFIAVKSVNLNGQTEFTVYDKRPPMPQEPVFNPKEYVRMDEVENIVAAILEAKEAHHESV